MELKGPVLFVGKAKSSLAAHTLVKKTNPGISSAFFDDDSSKSDFKTINDVLAQSWGTVVLSPGYPDKDWIRTLQSRGAFVTQELNIAAAHLGSEKILAITGSVGKSTTAHVLQQVFQSLGVKSFLAGNIGVPLAQYVLENKNSVEMIVLEMSSYQIERMDFAVDRGLLLNLHPNHLDRYKNVDEYYSAKLRLSEFTRNGLWAVKNGGALSDYAARVTMQNKLHWIEAKPEDFVGARLIGHHNRENLSVIEKWLCDMDNRADLRDIMSSARDKVHEALMQAAPLEHRLELFFDREHAAFVNDSKATTIESVLKAQRALREFFPDRKLHFLIGGKDKNLCWSKLKSLSADKNLDCVFFGEVAPEAQKQSELKGPVFASLSLALKNRHAYLQKIQDVLVLSPGGSSHDEFHNFEERGSFFKKIILSAE